MISWVIQYFLCIEVLPWTTYPRVVGDIYVFPNGRRLQSTLFLKRLWMSSSGLTQRRGKHWLLLAALPEPISLLLFSEAKWLGLPDTSLKAPEWPAEAAVTVSHLVASDSATRGLQPARLLCPWDFPGKWVAMPCSRVSPDPGIEPASPALQVLSLLTEPLTF